MRSWIKTLLYLLPFTVPIPTFSQEKIIKGYIKDAQSDERLPFASMQFLRTGKGRLSDSAGTFSFQFTSWPADTLLVTSVGYQDTKIFIGGDLLQKATKDTLALVIQLERGKYGTEVVIKRKIDRGLLLWRRIVRRKPFNDRFRFDNFSYELYNKLEVDINRLNFDKFKDRTFIRPFKSVIEENIDTSEGPPFLPVLLTETVSDYYFKKDPRVTREVIKGSKTVGIKNESISLMLGGTEQNVNIYNNYIPVFDKQFVSPISDYGDNYYRYRIVDTQIVNSQRLIHLAFFPKRAGQNTFGGDCWVHDSTYAIQKMNLYLSKEANINFIDKLSLIQEYTLLRDTTWFISKDKFVVNIHPIGKTRPGVIGRKTTTYRNAVLNDSTVERELAKNKLKEEILFGEGAMVKEDDYWESSRHEELSSNERGIYHMIDTIQKMPVFKKYSNFIYFLTWGYKKIGIFSIGPWYNWITYNTLEGMRVRFDLNTNSNFSEDVYLHGYLAYGFGDKKFKYKLDATYYFTKSPRSHLLLSYQKDLDYGQQYYDQISQDNIFALAIRKSGVPLKFLLVEEKKAEYYHELKSGLSGTLSATHRIYDPLLNLPPKSTFQNGTKPHDIISSEISFRVRYAYLEKFLITTFDRLSLGSDYPILETKFAKGIPDVLESNYSYTKLSGSVSDYIKIPPLGSIYYNVFGGRTFGISPLPYMLLDIPPGNEVYYYNKYAFNLMNRYEYLLDKYAGINFEHNIGSGIFRFVPGVRKLKLRQFYSAKVLWGSLSEANQQYNMPPGSVYQFELLNGRTYMEAGVGVDNILKLFRVDFIWRILPQPLPKEQAKRFGIFGSFRLVL